MRRTDTQVVEYVPRSVTVTQCELQGKTTIEGAPDSAQAKIYTRLAEKIAAHEVSKSPNPLGVTELREWAASWADQILALESGTVVGQRAGI